MVIWVRTTLLRFGFERRTQSFSLTSRSSVVLGEQSCDRASRADFWRWLMAYRYRG